MEQVRTNKSDMSITDSIMQLDQIVSLLNLDISFKGTNCQEREICPEDKIKIIETCIGVLKDNIWNMKELLTIKEASVYLGIAKSYLYKLTSAKKYHIISQTVSWYISKERNYMTGQFRIR